MLADEVKNRHEVVMVKLTFKAFQLVLIQRVFLMLCSFVVFYGWLLHAESRWVADEGRCASVYPLVSLEALSKRVANRKEFVLLI